MPQGLSIKFIKKYAFNIKKKSNFYIISVGSDRGFSKGLKVNKIVFCLGQTINHDTAQEYYLKHFSRQYNLKYSPVGYVCERNFDKFESHKPVIVRGLGLNFFDVMNELMIGRGGTFTKQSDGSLTYHPSGKEPKLIIGSRSGIPYRCRAINQKANGKHPRPYFITKKYIDSHYDHKLTYKDFIHLLLLDMDLIYYPRLISQRYPKLDPKKFKKEFINTPNHLHFIQLCNFKKADLFNLHKLLNPIDYHKVSGVNDYQGQIVKLLSGMVKQSEEGNVSNPLVDAIEVIRDSRNYIRYLVNNHYFTKESYYEEFLPNFNQINKKLIIGGSINDIKRLIALIRAKIAIIIPDKMVIKMIPPNNHMIFHKRSAKFLAYSKEYPNKKFFTDEMIEARNPTPDLSLARGTLTSNLIDKGILSELQIVLPHLKMVTLDNTNINPDTDQMIDAHGNVEPDLYMFGVGTEGIHWFTQTSPHTSGHDANLRAAERIAKDLLGIEHQKFNLL